LWWGGRVEDEISTHHIILACSELEPFKVSREGSSVGVSKDVVMLQQDVRGVSLERVLFNCPVCHSKQQSVLVKNREGGRDARSILNASNTRGACPAVASRARVPLNLNATMCAGRPETAENFSSEADARRPPPHPSLFRGEQSSH
jgi:hypothetical protein